MDFNGAKKLKISGIFLVFMVFAVSHTMSRTIADNAKRPNIIIIYSDDQGLYDLGIYGRDDIHTPHTDRLAERGVRFTQMYAPSSICSPSRAGLLTGRYPQRAGMPGNASPPPINGLKDGKGDPGLSNNQPTLGKIFREAEYRTAMLGKWHLGYSSGNLPSDHGFDYWFGHLGGVIDNYSHFFHWNGPTRHDLWRNGDRIYKSGQYFPDMMVKEAKKFITDNKDRPFLLYYALNTPHWPYQGDKYWIDRYQKEDVAYPRNIYGAFVSAQDERIGMLMAVLEDLELVENTIVIFQSDNGHAVSERAHFGGGSAGPYRGAKRSLFEGGIRVPAIVSWPGVIPENEAREQMVHGMDWLPTLADFLDIKLPNKQIDGKSIRKVIMTSSAPSPHKILFWKRTFRNQWAVRRGPWKLYANAFDQPGMAKLSEQDKELFLANVQKDPGEQKNLVNEFPEIVEELRGRYERWTQKYPQNYRVEN